jgi:hypothetical protein
MAAVSSLTAPTLPIVSNIFRRSLSKWGQQTNCLQMTSLRMSHNVRGFPCQTSRASWEFGIGRLKDDELIRSGHGDGTRPREVVFWYCTKQSHNYNSNVKSEEWTIMKMAEAANRIEVSLSVPRTMNRKMTDYRYPYILWQLRQTSFVIPAVHLLSFGWSWKHGNGRVVRRSGPQAFITGGLQSWASLPQGTVPQLPVMAHRHGHGWADQQLLPPYSLSMRRWIPTYQDEDHLWVTDICCWPFLDCLRCLNFYKRSTV